MTDTMPTNDEWANMVAVLRSNLAVAMACLARLGELSGTLHHTPDNIDDADKMLNRYRAASKNSTERIDR